MHLVITDIATSSPRDMELPHLARLLQTLTPTRRVVTDEFDWAMPHERLLAHCLGLAEHNTPWAAWETTTLHQPCAWITLAHWQVGIDHITMGDPAALQLDKPLIKAYFDLLAPFFAEVGITLHPGDTTRWLATGKVFADLPCASIERASGRNIDAWMPAAASPAGAQLRRLQNEVQMLLYTHALSDRAQAAGHLPVNSFWVSGAGQLDARPDTPPPRLVRSLQQPAWQHDDAACRSAWQAIDRDALQPLVNLLDGPQAAQVQLSLCSENVSQTFEWRPPTLARRLRTLLPRSGRADWSPWL